MEEILKELILKHAGEILTFGVTAIIALIKKKLDLRKLRRQGKLVD